MKRFDGKRILSLLLTVSLLLSCAACGGPGGSSGAASAAAASMWLVKTEGSVAVTDDAGADVSLTERLGLFSGYGVATQAASYGWIDLDETKLTKMDENSNVTVQKDGKNLMLTVNSGSLFFNVTEPLAEDETMEIRSANMVTAVRGTCGWVEVTDPEHMNVYILEGTVECSVGDVTESVTAGQTAVLSAAEGTIAVDDFKAGKIPAFVAAEVKKNEDLAAAILDASGLDATGGSGTSWTLENGILTISGTGPMEEFADHSPWYDQCEDITAVVIEDGVTSIAAKSFQWCSNLVEVAIPDSVTSIGAEAFSMCHNLASVSIPDGVTVIEDDTFKQCFQFTSIDIPDGVTSIGARAFMMCFGLTDVHFPDTLNEIGYQAFNGDPRLTDIVLPDSVTAIGEGAFHDCISLSNVVISGNISVLPDSVFDGCGALTSITVPDGVTSIGFRALAGNLQSLTIPASVTFIDRYAFASHNLTDIYFGGTEAQWQTLVPADGWWDEIYHYDPPTIHYNAA